jgi:hypothetical protein
MSTICRILNNVMLAAALFAYACAPVQTISEQSVEDKLARIKLGITNKTDIENLLGSEHSNEKLRWIYSLSDTAFGFSEHKGGTAGGGFPTAGTMPTNTRALVTVRFAESGTVNGLEVARYFSVPFINDY